MARQEDDPRPGTVGRYRVIGSLGSGSMGRVLLAEDPLIKRRVALKVLRADAFRDTAEDREQLLRFQREAEVSGLLNHPGIVAIYDVGEEPGVGPFLAMEYVEGRTLDRILQEGPPLPMAARLGLVMDLAEALDHAHARGIIHRDVKPGNVIVTPDGRPKLLDFGIARRQDGALTQTGTFLGTPRYASPEQIREGRVDRRSDLFSLAVLAHELLGGRNPFPGESINTILYRIVHEPPEPPEPQEGLDPVAWKRVFDRALAKQPELRHEACVSFVRNLAEAVDLSHAAPARVAPPVVRPPLGADPGATVVRRPRSRRWPWALAAALVVLALGTGYLLRVPRRVRTQVQTTPPGAALLLNGRPAGTTPLVQDLAPGDRLRLELRGHAPVEVQVRKGQTLPPLVLAPVVTQERIDSVPPGAAVVLDERPLEGTTPLTVPWNQAQVHRLTLTLGDRVHASDYRPGETPGGQALVLREAGPAGARPEPSLDPAAPAVLQVKGTFAVRLRVDGKDRGELAPGAELALPAGPHVLELASGKHAFRERREVVLDPGRPQPLVLPALATVTVETFPGTGKVFIDGQDTGLESDGCSLRLAHGRHTLTVRGPRGIHTETLDLRGDRSLRFPL